MRFIVGLTLVAVASASALAEAPALKVQVPKRALPLTATLEQQRAVLARVPDGVQHAVSCRAVTGLAHTRLCMFSSKGAMNAALNRISEFVETDRGVLSDRAHATNEKNEHIDGHDLQLSDVKRYLRAWDRGQRTAKAARPPADKRWIVDVERTFIETYLRTAVKEGGKDVLLGIAATADDGAIHHEVLHAAFFTNARYRRAVKLFWTKRLTADERAAIKEVLHGVAGYDTDDEPLVLNEVQAYLLMTGAERELLGAWAERLAPLLHRALDARGAPPPRLTP